MAITKMGSKLTVGAMNYEGKNVAKKIFDLKGNKGERVRVHVGLDGKYTIATQPRQNLLVCELDIPARKYIHTEKVVDGKIVVESKEKALELKELIMNEYLKEVEKKI